MSCYFRYMKDVLEDAGVRLSPDNKKDIDRILHEMVSVAYKNCSPAWKEVKAHIKADAAAREAFIADLKDRLKKPA